jgi:hypothetical protein
VDFAGLPIGIQLTTDDGSSPQTAHGLRQNAVQGICKDLKAQAAKDGQPWDQLCVMDADENAALRVLAPSDYASINHTAFKGYYPGYVDRVWQHYSSNTLSIDTQASAGVVNCSVSGDKLICGGDNRAYSKPTTADIFGCNTGPFAIQPNDNLIHLAVVPRLCAAFNRGALLTGDFQPSEQDEYYTSTPTNWYSAIVHKYEVDGKGYAFAYDDVIPDGGIDTAGSVSSQKPVLLTVTVGGPMS